MTQPTRVDAFTDDALSSHDTVRLVEALHAGEVSVREVIEAAIARIERVDPDLNAIAYAAYDRGRVQARDPRGGYFSGVPTVLKDNVDVQGMPTQQGSDAFVSPPCKRDGDFARMWHATGLLTLGKTQLSEFGFSASAEHTRLGAVRSPWHRDHTAGASSAGSAALVASGAMTIAHANDGGGSIRIPAAVNGLVGLKPTRARLAQDKVMRQMPVRMISDGVVTRSVRDTAAFFREAEKVYRNLELPPVGDITRPGRRRLKVAVLTRSIDREATPEVRDLTMATADILERLGHHVEQIEPPVPTTFSDDFLLYWAMLASYLVRSGRLTFGRSWDVGKVEALTVGLDRHLRRNAHRLPRAISRLKALSQRSARFYGSYDVMLSPTLATETPAIGHLEGVLDYDTTIERLLEWVAFTPLANASGDPAISLPLATTAAGLPLGMMFSAGAGREATLLELAYELEEASPFARLSGG